MAVNTDWTIGYTGPQGTYYFCNIDAPNTGVEYTNLFPYAIKSPWVQVSLYSADGADFAASCSLEMVGVYVETNDSDVSTEKDVEIVELLPAVTQGADPVVTQFQIEKYPAIGYKFSVTSAGDASADNAVIGIFVPIM